MVDDGNRSPLMLSEREVGYRYCLEVSLQGYRTLRSRQRERPRRRRESNHTDRCIGTGEAGIRDSASEIVYCCAEVSDSTGVASEDKVDRTRKIELGDDIGGHAGNGSRFREGKSLVVEYRR